MTPKRECRAHPALSGVKACKCGAILKNNKPAFQSEQRYLRVYAHHKTNLVHRMIMETFAPRPDSDNLVVHHIDEDKTNNSLENLQWCTHGENMKLRGPINRARPMSQGERVKLFELRFDAGMRYKDIALQSWFIWGQTTAERQCSILKKKMDHLQMSWREALEHDQRTISNRRRARSKSPAIN